VHIDISLQSLTWQSTAQQKVLHAWDSKMLGHAAPPYALGVMMERVRCCSPPPHPSLHTPYEPQFEVAQSTGQDWALHGSSTEVAGHSLPLHDGCTTMVRVCVRLPPPQVFVHVDHSCQ
jgi:hypothetical protein